MMQESLNCGNLKLGIGEPKFVHMQSNVTPCNPFLD